MFRAQLTGDGGVWVECLLGKNGASSLPHAKHPLCGLVDEDGLWNQEQHLEPHSASVTTLGKSPNSSGLQFPHQQSGPSIRNGARRGSHDHPYPTRLPHLSESHGTRNTESQNKKIKGWVSCLF